MGKILWRRYSPVKLSPKSDHHFPLIQCISVLNLFEIDTTKLAHVPSGLTVCVFLLAFLSSTVFCGLQQEYRLHTGVPVLAQHRIYSWDSVSLCGRQSCHLVLSILPLVCSRIHSILISSPRCPTIEPAQCFKNTLYFISLSH